MSHMQVGFPARNVFETDKDHRGWPTPPNERFPKLFQDMASLHSDPKTTSDLVAKKPSGLINAEYRSKKNLPDFDLSSFVEENFDLPKRSDVRGISKPGNTAYDYARHAPKALTSLAGHDELPSS